MTRHHRTYRVVQMCEHQIRKAQRRNGDEPTPLLKFLIAHFDIHIGVFVYWPLFQCKCEILSAKYHADMESNSRNKNDCT